MTAAQAEGVRVRREPPARESEFTLVLAGGGARGFAHVGVLRALEASGLRPAAIIGVSMGAVVAATYALNPDWYRLLVAMDTGVFPGPGSLGRAPDAHWLRRVITGLGSVRDMWTLVHGWGVGERAQPDASALLHELTQDMDLDEGRIPIALCATDLRTGVRVVLEKGLAADAAYASAALAGVVPPLEKDGYLLCDGAYADLAPIDVARRFGPPTVIAVDLVQPLADGRIHNGFQALTRAVEICHLHHAELRFQEADVVLRPHFRRPIGALDFGAKRECIAAGVRAVHRRRAELLAAVQPAMRGSA
ncbi:MAG: patatin-like phospholipase family protein [Gemmatimonadota bacterium]